jgi:cell division protein ZapA
MGQILVKVNGRDYPIACDDGGEDRVRAIGAYVDEKVREMVGTVGQAGDARLMLLAALNLGDELANAYDEIERHRNAPPREVIDPALVAANEAALRAKADAEALAAREMEAAEAARRDAKLAENARARSDAAAQAWISKCEELAKRLAEFEAIAGAAQSETAIARQRVAALEAEAEDAKIQSADAETRALEAQTRSGALEAEVAALKAKLAEIEPKLAKAERRALEAEAQTTAATVRASELGRRLDEIRTRSDEEYRQRELLSPLLARIERLAEHANHAA